MSNGNSAVGTYPCDIVVVGIRVGLGPMGYCCEEVELGLNLPDGSIMPLSVGDQGRLGFAQDLPPEAIQPLVDSVSALLKVRFSGAGFVAEDEPDPPGEAPKDDTISYADTRPLTAAGGATFKLED